MYTYTYTYISKASNVPEVTWTRLTSRQITAIEVDSKGQTVTVTVTAYALQRLNQVLTKTWL